MQEIMIFLANHTALTSTLLGLLTVLMVVEFLRLKRNNYCADITKAIQLINRENAVVIDIRSNELFRKGHIIDAQSLPANEIKSNPKKLEKFSKKAIILTCSQGYESQKIAPLLVKQGYNAYSLSGGIRAWVTAELPLVKE